MGLTQRVRAWFSGAPAARFDDPRAARFSGVYPVDQLVLWAENRVGKIDRARALTVPAVLRGRNMICSISTLPLEAVDEDNRVQPRPLFRQFDPNVPNVVVIAQVLEDLLFDAVSWWRVTGFDEEGLPSRVERYAPDQVSLQPPASYQRGYLPSGMPTEGAVWMAGQKVPFDQVIQFQSPNPGLLVAGERAIRRAIALDEAAELYANNPRRRGYFAPKDGADPADDDAILDALDAWHAASSKRVDGYVPYALDYNAIQDSTPAELQLVQMQRQAGLDLANALGIDPEDLGISTTSRTYQNATDRRQDRINEVLAPYMRAITDRLGMLDVTRDGLTVRFSLRDYLKADPKTRAEVQAIYHGLGATDGAEIREDEGRPPRAIEPPQAPRQVPSIVGEPLQEITATATPHTFAREGLTFGFEPDATFAVDTEARTITGLAVPWGKVARSGGRRYRFAKGSVKWSAVNRVKLLRDHVNTSAIGKAIRLEDTDEGLVTTFKVSPGAAGDEALALAADEVLDGLSIGVDFRESDLSPDPQNPGAFLVAQSALREVSLTAVPAFDDSRLTSVKAAREETGMPEETTETAPAAPAPVTFSAEQFADLMGRLNPPTPAPRPVVDPTRPTAVTTVTESLPYRFSYEGGRTVFKSDADHDFSHDLALVTRGLLEGTDFTAPRARIEGLIKAAFADVETADVTAINPNRYRPDLWQAQTDLTFPLWDMVNSGSTDGTKFDIPKYASSSGLVGPATEKVEPAGGAMTVELQTITPTQVWGKVEVSRQAWRAGSNPALSGLLWDQMLREYYEDREAAVATFLNTLTAAADITLTATPAASPDNDDDQVTVAELEAAIADLQFSRGGNQIRAFAVHQALFRVLARVKDDMGRPIYPIQSPSNANGTSQPRFRYIDIAGVRAVGAAALGSVGTAETNSWLFDPAKVRGWASAPERLFWDFGATVQTANLPQLSFVTLGIYGDVAFGNTNIDGVRQVRFDPSS
jgi:HK97 family phage prohead protease